MNTALYWLCMFLAGVIVGHLGVPLNRWEGWALMALMITIRIISHRPQAAFNGTRDAAQK